MNQNVPASGGTDAAQSPPAPAPRALKVAVIVMGVILIVGFIAVFTTIGYRVANPRAPVLSDASGAGFETTVAIPVAAEVTGVDLVDDRALITVRGGNGAITMIVLDVAKGRIVGRFSLAPQ